MNEDLQMHKVSLEKELEAARRSTETVREENSALKRSRTELESKNETLKRELKFIRVAFRMGGLRYSCRALDQQDTGTVPVAAFRSIVMKSNVNLSDEETDIIIQRAMRHGDGQVIHYEGKEILALGCGHGLEGPCQTHVSLGLGLSTGLKSDISAVPVTCNREHIQTSASHETIGYVAGARA